MALTSTTDALQRCVDIARDVVLDKIERGQDFAFLSRAGERLYAQAKGPGSFVLHQLSMPTGKQPLRAVEADLLRAQVYNRPLAEFDRGGELHRLYNDSKRRYRRLSKKISTAAEAAE